MLGISTPPDIRYIAYFENDGSVEILVGKRIEKNVVDHAEDNRGGTDAEGQSTDCNQGESPILAEIAEGVTKVADEIVEMRFQVGVAHLFFDSFEAAEFLLGAPMGFFGAGACGDALAYLLLQMEAEFFVKIVFGTRFMK
jgi:hypothetical protein